MQLYGFPASPNTWKVRAFAAELGIPLDLKFVDLGKGEQRRPDYLALNPTGRTPTLVDGDFIVWESEAILHYLAEQKPTSLWPADARTRASIVRWESWALAHWGRDACQPLVYERFVKKAFGRGAPDAAIEAKGLEAFKREAAVLDTQLAKTQYLAGDTLTLADFAVAAGVVYAGPAAMPVGDYPQLKRWMERVLSLPSWRSTAPQMAAAA